MRGERSGFNSRLGARCLVSVGILVVTALPARGQTSTPTVITTGTETVDDSPRPAVSGAWEEEPSRRSAVQIDFDRYLPMPLPESVEEQARERRQPESRWVSFDLATRTELVGAVSSLEGPLVGQDKTVGSAGDPTLYPVSSAPLLSKNFSSLSLVGSPENYPWRVAVKLFMSFRDTGGTLRYYVCSGSLIDSLHVITAGHCVYFHTDSDNGWVFNDWAESITVVPGYENGARPYGDARAVQLHSWTGWTGSSDFDDDIGIIDLDRPIGALTGWHGYGWYGGCGSFTGGSYRHAGYPAASPYDGLFLYTNYGNYDSCEEILGIWYGNEVRFNAESWGGQSGSGSYEPRADCPSCWVRAVLSNGTSSYTDDIRITQGKFDDIGGIISADTPTALDLVALDTRSTPSSITGGSQLSSMSYLVHNHSSASWSGAVAVNVYLSTNDNISTTDTFLQRHTFTSSFTPRSSVRVNVSTPPTIPASTTTGTYYLGVILDVSDANTGNNDSDGQDASPIFVSERCYYLTRSHTGSGTNPVASPTSSSGCSAGYYHAGQSIQVTASPATGWQVVGWHGTSNNASTATINSLTMPAGGHTVTVDYEQTCYVLTRSHTGSGNNPVASPSGSAGCAVGGFHFGEAIQVTAGPGTGWEVASWMGTGNDGSTSVVNNLTMPLGRHTVTVNYVQSCYAMTFSHTGMGSDPVPSPDRSPGCEVGKFHAGDVIALAAAPDAGWAVSGWTGTDLDTATTISNLLTCPDSAHVVAVHYGISIFDDGFESGDTMAWSSASP